MSLYFCGVHSRRGSTTHLQTKSLDILNLCAKKRVRGRLWDDVWDVVGVSGGPYEPLGVLWNYCPTKLQQIPVIFEIFKFVGLVFWSRRLEALFTKHLIVTFRVLTANPTSFF